MPDAVVRVGAAYVSWRATASPVLSATTCVPPGSVVATGLPKSPARRTRSPNSRVTVPAELSQSAGTKLLICPCTTFRPPLFVVIEEETNFTLAQMAASSSASTVIEPPAVTSATSTRADARLDTLLLATTNPSAVPVAPHAAAAVEDAALDTVAFSRAPLTAETSTSPVTSTVTSRRVAAASMGCSPSKASEIGPPSTASTALNKMFCGFQPRVLKASTTAAPVSPDADVVVIVASRPAVVAASIVRAAAVRSTFSTVARAAASTRLVTTWAAMETTEPVP